MLTAQERLEKIRHDIDHAKSPTDFISIPIPRSLYDEVLLRTGGTGDPVYTITDQAYFFLEGTLGDSNIWTNEHAEEVEDDEATARRVEYGSANKGLYWKSLFLPNGTQVRMTYQGKVHSAEIRHEELLDGDESFSPSQWASHVAGGTSRNAWRDLYISTPGSGEWKLAATAKREGIRGDVTRRMLADPERSLAAMKEVLPEERFKEMEKSLREIIDD